MEALYANKNDIIKDLQKRVDDKVLEKSNFDILKKLVEKSDSLSEAIAIAELGTTYKRTGFHFDKRIEKIGDTIHFLRKNNDLSFSQGAPITHKLLIGDNFPALLNLLVEYKGKIDVIYIDPPYGKDNMGEFAQTNYENAITRDNLLSMLYPRLLLAKQLLSENGVIFCSIDDRNHAYIKGLFDEIFGASNFIASLPTIMNLKGNQDEFGFAGTHENTLVYTKDKSQAIFNKFDIDEEEVMEDWQEDEMGFYKKGANLKATGINAPRTKRPNLFYHIYINDKNEISFEPQENSIELLPITNGEEMSWRWSKEKLRKEIYDVIIVRDSAGISLYKKQRPGLGELPSAKPKTLFYKPEYSSGNGTNQFLCVFGKKLFNNPKPVDLIKDFVFLAGNKNSIILDFFAGSGTTGQAVLELNNEDGGERRFILVTNNEITDINPGGIAFDVTSKRLKRVMTGKCYDGTSDFAWIKKNTALGGNLEVTEIDSCANYDKSIFEKIDETLYGKEKFSSIKEKIEWVCENFENTQKFLEEK